MTRMRQLGIPNWLRRSLEAALVAGLVAIVSLVGGRLSAPPDIVVLPRGISGALLGPSSYFMKSPPQQFTDAEARERTLRFIAGEDGRLLGAAE